MNKIAGLLELARYHAIPREQRDAPPASFTYLSTIGARDDGESSGRPDHEEQPHGHSKA